MNWYGVLLSLWAVRRVSAEKSGRAYVSTKQPPQRKHFAVVFCLYGQFDCHWASNGARNEVECIKDQYNRTVRQSMTQILTNLARAKKWTSRAGYIKVLLCSRSYLSSGQSARVLTTARTKTSHMAFPRTRYPVVVIACVLIFIILPRSSLQLSDLRAVIPNSVSL